jgi:hypothetical protein
MKLENHSSSDLERTLWKKMKIKTSCILHQKITETRDRLHAFCLPSDTRSAGRQTKHSHVIVQVHLHGIYFPYIKCKIQNNNELGLFDVSDTAIATADFYNSFDVDVNLKNSLWFENLWTYFIILFLLE